MQFGMLVIGGWGISTVLPQTGLAHFGQHVCSTLGKEPQGGFRSIWLAVVWSVWHHRNSLVFRGDQLDVERIIDLVQYRSWSWLSAKVQGFQYSLFE